ESAYQTGGIDWLALIDTARTLESVHVEHIEAQAEFEKAYADLERAVGTELPRDSEDPGQRNRQREGAFMKRLIIGITIGVLLALAGSLVVTRIQRRPVAETATAGAPKARYQCAMHPQIVSDKPDLCPICGMRLQRVDDPSEVGSQSKATEKTGNGGKIVFYRHPMRPDVTSPTPAKDEMGMDYIPVREDEVGDGGGIPGHASFSLSPERQQLIGVKTEEVERRALDVEIRTVGKVA